MRHYDIEYDLQPFLDELERMQRIRRAKGLLCPTCNGDDAMMPCAYPSEGKLGCLRDKRLSSENAT